MRWPVVLVCAYVLLAAEMGLREDCAWDGGTMPSLVLPFMVFVALHAPGTASLWTGFLIGLAIDLLDTAGSDALVVVGPHALGCLLAVYFVLTVRGMLIRRNPWTLVALSVLSTLLVHIVVVAIFSFRKVFHEPIVFSGFQELSDRFLASLLTAATAVVLAFLLFPVTWVFGFADPHLRRAIVRR